MEEDENEVPDYEKDIYFEDELDGTQVDTTKLVEVSEKTKHFLEESSRQSLANANRIQTQSRFGSPKGCGNENSTTGLLHENGDQ